MAEPFAGASRAARDDARGARVVRPRTSVLERFRRIVTYRELLVGMTRKELKVKYKNSVLGFAWSLLNPLLYLVVFYVAFQLILGSGLPDFAIFLLSGLLVWNFFSTGLAAACSSVVANSGLVKKVSFPREILPLAAAASMLVHFFLQSLVLFAVLAVVRWHVAWAYIPLVPLALLVLMLLTGAFGILLSATNVYLRDTQHFLELALLAWFWMTPIVYSFMTIHQRGGLLPKLFLLNPVTPIVLIFQRAVYAKVVNPKVASGAGHLILPTWTMTHYLLYLSYSVVVGVVALAIAIVVFGRSEANFAEEL